MVYLKYIPSLQKGIFLFCQKYFLYQMGVFFTFSPYVYEDKSYHLHDFKILRLQTLFKMSTSAILLDFFPHNMGYVNFPAAKFQKSAMFCQNKKKSPFRKTRTIVLLFL